MEYTNESKYEIKQWLKQNINYKMNISDIVLDIEKKIYCYLESNNLILNVPKNIFLIRLIGFLYNNSESMRNYE